jgi:AraC-like DNA-binding protein
MLARFPLHASVFFTGTLCRSVAFGCEGDRGHIHVLRQGKIGLRVEGRPCETIVGPQVLFLPRYVDHAFEPIDSVGADLVCATVAWGDVAGNPLLAALPPRIVLPFDEATLQPGLALLFAEAAGNQCGKQAAIDGLMGYFLVTVLRVLLADGQGQAGLLAAMGDSRLATALTAMHAAPERAWTVELLAEVAGMSRARFAAAFRRDVDATPLTYLANWRMGLVQGKLRQGQPLKTIARTVGYKSPAALTRAFTRRFGCSPRDFSRASRTGQSPRPASPK